MSSSIFTRSLYTIKKDLDQDKRIVLWEFQFEPEKGFDTRGKTLREVLEILSSRDYGNGERGAEKYKEAVRERIKKYYGKYVRFEDDREFFNILIKFNVIHSWKITMDSGDVHIFGNFN